MIETGGDRDRFWRSTLREIELDLEVAGERHTAEEQSRRWHTWHAAALPNVKKFPPFSEFVRPAEPANDPSPRAPQSGEAQIEVLKGIFARAKKDRGSSP